MKIESADKDIRSLLSSGFYKIPRFQRPYSWDRENVLDFWNDITRDNLNDDYFIGSMVVYNHDKLLFGIVDGQQRLTTITILLCVIRNKFSELGFENLSKGIHGLIERNTIDNKLEYVLSTESSFPFFQDHIQKYGTPEIDVEPGIEEQNLKRAFEQLNVLLNDTVNSIEIDPTLNDERKRSEIENKLKLIRDAILDLKLIFVELDNEDDAYLIFETLNTRGKDLSISDLVKNHLTKNIKTKNEANDPTKIKWEKMRETIEASSANLHTDTFIHHFWLSRYEYLPVKKLFKSIKKKITKKDASNFINYFYEDAKLYRAIHEPNYIDWKNEEKGITDALRALQIFRVSQPTPCVLSLVRAYKNDEIKNSLMTRAVVSIEKFHFLFTAVTSQRSSGGISQMYVALARRIFEAKNAQEVADIVKDLQTKLRSRVPSFEEVQAVFSDIVYTKNITKQKPLVKYIVTYFHKENFKNISANYSEMTIEHLSPQSNIGQNGFTDSNIGQLGNLILVPKKLNQELSNKSFLDKKNILIKNNITLEKEIRDANSWGIKEIETRTSNLAGIAYNTIWKI